jgi:hypothetical protein
MSISVIEEIVQLTITRQNAGLARANFGIPLILGASVPGLTPNPKPYTSLSAVAADFIFTTTDNTTSPATVTKVITDEYIMAAKIFAQDIKPAKIYIAQLTGDEITVAADDTVTYDFGAAYDRITMNNSEFYGLLLTSAAGQDDIELIALKVDADEQPRILGVSAIVTDYTSIPNILNDLHNLNYKRTFYTEDNVANNFIPAAWMGKMLPMQPGSATWAFKNLNSVQAADIGELNRLEIDQNNGNYYVNAAGSSFTVNGKMLGGDYIDTIIGIDWLDNTIKIDMTELFKTAPKVPYNTAGITLVENTLNGSLAKAVQNGIINEYEITVPRYEDTTSSERGTRVLNNVSFTAVLTGAIQKVVINGVVTF